MTASQYSTQSPDTSKHASFDVSVNANAITDHFHAVIVRPVADRKPPVGAGWADSAASAGEVATALAAPDLEVAFIPGRSSLLIVDIDVGKGRPVSEWADRVEKSLGPPLCTIRTPSGGLHLLYRCDTPVADSAWQGGDIKCGSGYAVMWDVDAVLAAHECLEDAESVDTTRWPVSAQQRASSKPRRMTRRASRPSASLTDAIVSRLRFVKCAKVEYRAWLHTGFGLHRAEAYGLIEDGLGMWVAWSQQDPARYHEGECGRLWERFDPDPVGKKPVTHRTVFALAKRFGYRGGRRRRKPIRKWGVSDDPSLNGRQQQELNFLYSRAKQQRASRRDGLLVQVNQADVARLMDCSRKTVGRDMAHLQAVKRMRPVGRATVKHALGGHVERIYELLPASDRHKRQIGMISSDQKAAWQSCIEERAEVPDGPLVQMDGRTYVVLPPHVSGRDLPVLIPVESRAPP